MGAPGSEFTPQHYQLVMDWCWAVMHNDNDSSIVHHNLQVASLNEVFQKWACTRINATPGPATSPCHNPSQFNHYQQCKILHIYPPSQQSSKKVSSMPSVHPLLQQPWPLEWGWPLQQQKKKNTTSFRRQSFVGSHTYQR